MRSEWTLRRYRPDQYARTSGSEEHLCKALMHSVKEDAFLGSTLDYEPIVKNGARR